VLDASRIDGAGPGIACAFHPAALRNRLFSHYGRRIFAFRLFVQPYLMTAEDRKQHPFIFQEIYK